MNYHYISDGIHATGNSCFRLTGTIGQTAAGYSSKGGFSVVSGFWAAAPTSAAAQDQLFFDGFEGC